MSKDIYFDKQDVRASIAQGLVTGTPDRIINSLTEFGYIIVPGWQPIETAPHNRWIWLHEPEVLKMDARFERHFAPHPLGCRIGRKYLDQWQLNGVSGNWDPAPTHWMPLPPAPSEAPGDD